MTFKVVFHFIAAGKDNDQRDYFVDSVPDVGDEFQLTSTAERSSLKRWIVRARRWEDHAPSQEHGDRTAVPHVELSPE